MEVFIKFLHLKCLHEKWLHPFSLQRTSGIASTFNQPAKIRHWGQCERICIKQKQERTMNCNCNETNLVYCIIRLRVHVIVGGRWINHNFVRSNADLLLIIICQGWKCAKRLECWIFWKCKWNCICSSDYQLALLRLWLQYITVVSFLILSFSLKIEQFNCLPVTASLLGNVSSLMEEGGQQ